MRRLDAARQDDLWRCIKPQDLCTWAMMASASSEVLNSVPPSRSCSRVLMPWKSPSLASKNSMSTSTWPERTWKRCQRH